MATKIQARRDTAANWTSVNPVLADGEPGFEHDTGKLKVGDGTTAWTGLAYLGAGSPGLVKLRIVFNAGSSAPFTNQNTPTVVPWGTGYSGQFQIRADLTGYTQARLYANYSVSGAAGAVSAVQYSLDNGTTWAYLDGGTGPNVPESLGVQVSSWVTIAAAARADVLLRFTAQGGDGVADPVMFQSGLELR